MGNIEARVSALEDRFAIMELLSRYAAVHDAYDLDGLIDCYTKDATHMALSASGVVQKRLEGHEAIRDSLASIYAAKSTPRRVGIVNPVIEDLTDASAKVNAYLTLIVVSEGKPELRAAGRLRHTLVKSDDGRWRIAEYTATMDTH